MQATCIWSLIQEDPTHCRAAKPMSCNYWAFGLETGSINYWGLHTLEPVRHNQRAAPCLMQLETSLHSNRLL